MTNRLAALASGFIKSKGLDEFFERGAFLSLHNCDHQTARPINWGRAWNAGELRRKSFSDLHKLWYVLVKEKNLLFTQQAEANRLGVQWLEEERMNCVFKSMARIKQVLSERNLAFQQARMQIEVENASDLQKQKMQYVKEMMQIKEKRHGFRRMIRYILRKHPHFD